MARYRSVCLDVHAPPVRCPSSRCSPVHDSPTSPNVLPATTSGRLRVCCWRAVPLLLCSIAWAASVGGDDLIQAVKAGDQTAVASLIKQGADVNAPEANGTTALHWAAYQRDAAIVKRLLAAGAKPERGERIRFHADAGSRRQLAKPKSSRCCWLREPTWNRPMPKDKPR